MTENSYKKKMSLTGFAAQLVTIGLLFVFWRLGQKWVVVPAAGVLIFLFFFLPGVIARMEQRFHKKALMLLATGKAAEVPRLASRQFLLSLFGASAPIDAKLGLAYAQTGQFEEALECLSHALPYAPANEAPALQSAYIKSLVVTGDPAKGEAEARQLLSHGAPRLPEVLVLMARARMALGKTGPETLELLEEASAHPAGGDLAMMMLLTRIEYQLAHGRKAEELHSDADSAQRFLRAWIHLVRGKLRETRGKRKEALESYARAVKEGKSERCWFADLARERFETLSTQGLAPNESADADAAKSESNHATTDLDDVVRRKKKKRR